MLLNVGLDTHDFKKVFETSIQNHYRKLAFAYLIVTSDIVHYDNLPRSV